MKVMDDTTWVHIRTEMELDRIKLIAIGILFLFFGATSVITQLFMTELLELGGLEVVNLPEPSIQGVLIDFWGDISFMSMIIILVAMSTFSSELDNSKSGYFYHARPISRGTYYLTRFWIRVGGVMLIFFISSLLVYGYSVIFFDPLNFGKILLSALLVSLTIGAVTAIVVSLSSGFSSVTSGVIGLLSLFLQILLSLIEPLKWLSPFSLSEIWHEIIFSSVDQMKIISHLVALILWIIIPCIIGLYHYSRRDLI